MGRSREAIEDVVVSVIEEGFQQQPGSSMNHPDPSQNAVPGLRARLCIALCWSSRLWMHLSAANGFMRTTSRSACHLEVDLGQSEIHAGNDDDSDGGAEMSGSKMRQSRYVVQDCNARSGQCRRQ
nr:hypothetical protein CFP56_13173 [Quercus suber]